MKLLDTGRYFLILVTLLVLASCSAETIDDVELASSGRGFAASDTIATDFVDVGGTFVHISHGEPTGGYTITQDANSKNWIFQTTSDYSGSDGPLLYFYISEEAFNAGVSADDRRYIDPDTSFVLHSDPVTSNKGQLTYEVENSAAQSISKYKTIMLWCETAKTIFYIAEINAL